MVATEAYSINSNKPWALTTGALSTFSLVLAFNNGYCTYAEPAFVAVSWLNFFQTIHVGIFIVRTLKTFYVFTTCTFARFASVDSVAIRFALA